jgi:group II intron reverse transcriptase/maturase
MLNEESTAAVTLEAVMSPENLRAAWLAVKANDGAPGVDGMGVEQTQEHLREHWSGIEAKLLCGGYKPAAVRAVEIPKANGGVRLLGVPNVQDRLIQQSLHQQLSLLWEATFSDHSYGFRPGRSAHDAVLQAREYIQAGKAWVADIDLLGFFDQVDHDKLMYLVSAKVRDKRLLRLIGNYLRAPMQWPDGGRSKRVKGTPQGGPLSPLLANIYLDVLDQELEGRGVSFVRYADDIAIFTSSARAAERVLKSVINWIEKHLKIPVNRDKSGHGPTDQSALLGFRLYRDGRVGVAPKAIKKLKMQVRQLWDARQSLTSRQLRDQWQIYIQGWWHYYQLADRRWELTDLTGWIRRHMRKCFWLRWHHPRGRINALRRLGIPERGLGNGYSSRGAWAMARHYVMHHALCNLTLQRHGFVIPWSFAEAPR